MLTLLEANLLLKYNAQAFKISTLLKNGKTDEAEKIVRDLYAEILPVFHDIETNLVTYLTNTGKRAKIRSYEVKSRIKSLASVIDKVILRKKSFSGLGDLVAASIYVDSDPEKVYEYILKNKAQDVVGHEFKEKSGDKKYGYHGSYHIDLMVNGLKTEIQIMTKKLAQYKNAAHEIYTKTRSGTATGSELSASQKLYALANRQYVREDMDSLAEEHNLKNSNLLWECYTELLTSTE